MNDLLLTKFQSSYQSYIKASAELRFFAEEFIKASLEESEGKKIDFDWNKAGEYIEICDSYGDVYNPAMVYLDEDGDVKISLKEDYEVTTYGIDSYYVADIAFAVKAHLLNNQK
jgi:hypothetical protein